MLRIVSLTIWFIYLTFIFVFVPYICKNLDKRFGLQVELSFFIKILGFFLILWGVILGFWCLIMLWKEGKGTPFFLYPPKKLVTTGPYKYSRNPMTLGAWFIFIGEAILFQSITLFLFFLFIALPVSILWIRRYEEPFLERNFGELYVNYKKSVKRWINLRALKNLF